jgi:hypothetical protein
VSGTIPSEAGQPYSVSQVYTDNTVARVQMNEPFAGGAAGSHGEVKAIVQVPTTAARSDILRPYGSWQYDVVLFSFPPGCPPQACVSYGANVNVLPLSTGEHITLSTLKPVTGSTLDVTATNCYGGVLTAFTRVIDGNGAYFPITGQSSGTTFTGKADLAHGYRGKYGPQGPARVSNPVGLRDSTVGVPCAQSEGPASVAAADHLMHLSMVIDITICPTTGSCELSSAIPQAGSSPVIRLSADANTQTSVPAAAEPATPVTAEPNFVG